MPDWSLYEEQTNDGSIPETVLGFHKNEFKRQKRDPRHRPRYEIFRNPREIRKKNREAEIKAALIFWGLQNSETAPLAKSLLQPSTPNPNQQAAQPHIRGPAKPSQSRLAQLGHMEKFPNSYSVSESQRSALFRSLLPPSSSKRPWQGVQVEQLAQLSQQPTNDRPKPYPMSSSGSQHVSHLEPQTPPRSRPTSPSNPPGSETGPSLVLSLPHSSTTQAPPQLPTPPETQRGYVLQHTTSPLPPSRHTRPIPGRVWNIVNEIKACRWNPATQLPRRIDLKASRFRAHFAATGILKPESELAGYRGDTRLFRVDVWDYLFEPRRHTIPVLPPPITKES